MDDDLIDESNEIEKNKQAAEQLEDKAEHKTEKTVPWTPRDVFAFLVLFLIVITVGSVIIKKALSTIMPDGASIITLFVSYLVSLLLLRHFTVGRGGEWADLGLKPFDTLSGIGLVLGSFIVTKIMIAFYAVIAEMVGVHQSKDLIDRLPDLFGRSISGFLLAVFVVAIIAPIVEELFFRGFVYASFRQHWGVTIAAISSSVLFAIFHQDPVTYIPIAIIGLALAYLYEKTGSLWPSIMLHSLNNLVSVVVLYYLRALIK